MFEPGHDNNTTCIDRLHCLWLCETLMSGRFKRVLEIGSWCGYSTRAFMYALRREMVGEVHLCDPSPHELLFREIEERPGKFHMNVFFYKEKSVSLLARDCDWDLLLVDGDHTMANCREEAKLLIDARVPALFVHDTCSIGEWGEEDNAGPALIRARLCQADYFLFEDAKRRRGMWTHRGMLWAGNTLELCSVGLDAFQRVASNV